MLEMWSVVSEALKIFALVQKELKCWNVIFKVRKLRIRCIKLYG